MNPIAVGEVFTLSITDVAWSSVEIGQRGALRINENGTTVQFEISGILEKPLVEVTALSVSLAN